jgi:arylsulfatase A-like enzyme
MCSLKRLAGFTTTLIALVFVQTNFTQTVFAEEGDRPNVIVMVADDLGWNDVGYHGGNIDTPSLDKLADQGVQLNRFYTTPICSPTRAALMTGRDPMRLGIAYGVILPWDNIGCNIAYR